MRRVFELVFMKCVNFVMIHHITLLLTPSKFTFILSVQNLNILSCTCTGRCHGSGALFWTSAHRAVDQTFSMKNSVSELFALNMSMPDGKSCDLHCFYVFWRFCFCYLTRSALLLSEGYKGYRAENQTLDLYDVVSGNAHFLLPNP